MTTTAAAVLDKARAEIGYHEGAGGANKYGAAYGMDRVAWCAEFQWWVITQAGGGPLIPKTAYTPTFYQWFVARGQAPGNPQPGDLVFYNWPGDAVDRIQHVGMVEAVAANGTLTTIEGNTTKGTGGDQSDGGWVARRSRARGPVVGFGRPAYGITVTAAKPAAGFDPDSLATLQVGMTGAAVQALQRFLNAFAWVPALPLLPVTGNYLDQTRAVVAAAQKQCGVTGADANGTIVGPATKAAFAARGARW